MRVMMVMVLIAACAYASAQQPEFPLDGSPAWYEITGDGATTGVAAPIRAITTRQVIAVAEPGYRFLAFGANNRWVTFAFNGALAYVPATAAVPVFSTIQPSNLMGGEMRLPGDTLEDVQKAIRKRADEAKAGTKPLAPNFTNRPTPRPTPMAVGAMGGGRGSVGGGREGGF